MLVLNKKSKIFLYIIIFVLLVLGGFAVEHFEKDAFVMETVATEDYIPYESDTKEVTDGKININSADTEQLVKLKGIGEKMSERIIKYRQENGPFMSIEEIMKVSGISEKKFELSLIHISEPTRRTPISYAVFCLKKKKKKKKKKQ